ncbi:MAG: protein kinase [Polyangiaceae bacterium]|nr:protein kinase [Polyangiaceae bacterium]
MTHDPAAESAEGDPLIGRDIQGRYRVLRRLGSGGMGVVYLGEHLMIKRKVAIKTLHAQFALQPSVVQRFHREALAATSIGNEHIVEVTDMGRLDNGALFMVLEYLDGTDLGQEIETQGPQPLGRMTRIMLQLCDALGAVHDKGIVHRDLKPDNIFLIRRGDDADFVKVLDFGISKFKTSLDDSGAKMTRTGMPMGTPYFMSPEQARGQSDVDHRADIHALGAIMYYALCGRYPFDATNLPELLIKICTEVPPPLSSLRPDLPRELEAVVHRALAPSREKRFADCAELRQALLPFRDVEGAPPSSLAFDKTTLDPSAPPVRRGTDAGAAGGVASTGSLAGAAHSVSDAPAVPTRFRRAWVVAALGSVTLVGAVGAWWAAREATAPPVPTPSASVVTVSNPTTKLPDVKPVAATVRITVTTEPDGAELLLDGNPIANPFDAELPQTDRLRTLEARLPNYPTVKRQLVLMHPQNVRLKLTPVSSEAASATKARSQRAGVSSVPTPEHTQASATQASGEPPHETPQPEPAPEPAAAGPTTTHRSPAPTAAPHAAPATKHRDLKSPF